MLTSSRTTNILLVVILAVGVAIVAMLASGVRGGPLDPTDAPASTMLRLNELPPSWHQLLSSNNGGAGGCNSTRFQCVMNDLAVLDKETGLVWQRTVPADTLASHFVTMEWCDELESGGRYGWRLPTIHEIRSLSDTSADRLPDGHPFIGALTAGADVFWTSTIYSSTGGVLWAFNADVPGQNIRESNGAAAYRRWCVRGGTAWDERAP